MGSEKIVNLIEELFISSSKYLYNDRGYKNKLFRHGLKNNAK